MASHADAEKASGDGRSLLSLLLSVIHSALCNKSIPCRAAAAAGCLVTSVATFVICSKIIAA